MSFEPAGSAERHGHIEATLTELGYAQGTRLSEALSDVFAQARQRLTSVGGLILDVGAGSGRWSGMFSDLPVSYLLVDNALENRPALSHLQCLADGEAIPFRDASFTVAILYGVTCYSLRPDLMFEEAHRILQPGGLLIFQTPFAYADYPPSGMIHLTQLGIETLARDSGFEQLILQGTNGGLETAWFYSIVAVESILRGRLKGLIRLIYRAGMWVITKLDRLDPVWRNPLIYVGLFRKGAD